MTPRRTRRGGTTERRGPPIRRSRRLAHLDPSNGHGPAAAAQRSPPVTTNGINGINGTLSISLYHMDLVIRPVPAIRPGVVMQPPIVLALKAPASRSERDSAYRDIGDVSGIWAYVSLVSEDQSRSLAPPRNDLLIGSVAGCIRPVVDESDPGDLTVGYAVFSNLAIAEPGTYCLKISLIDMDSNGSLFGRPMQSGTNLETVYSAIVRVAMDAETRQPGTNEVQTLMRLREQGIIA